MAQLPLSRAGGFTGWGHVDPRDPRSILPWGGKPPTLSEQRELARALRAISVEKGRAFHRAQNAATTYGAALRQYARQIHRIIMHYAEGEPLIVPPHKRPALREAIARYQAGILPWVRATVWRMLKEVDRRNLTAWQAHTQEMSAGLQKAITTAPVGITMENLLARQVELITSLPTDAAEWVHEKSLEAMVVGQRFAGRVEEIAGRLQATPSAKFAAALEKASDPKSFLLNRATLIARTETARSASVLVQARAEHIKAPLYRWSAVMDWKTRPAHRWLATHPGETRAGERLGVGIYAWDNAPVCEYAKGQTSGEPRGPYRAHAGQIFNCRCVPIPLV